MSNTWSVGHFIFIYMISDFLPLKPRTSKSTIATKSFDNFISRFKGSGHSAFTFNLLSQRKHILWSSRLFCFVLFLFLMEQSSEFSCKKEKVLLSNKIAKVLPFISWQCLPTCLLCNVLDCYLFQVLMLSSH